MSISLFLKVLGVWLGLLGLVWVINPDAGLEESPGPHSIFVARLLGTYQIVIGVMNWLISSQPHGLIRSFLWVDLAMNIVPVTLNASNMISRKFGKDAVVGIAAHGLPVIGLVVCLIRLR